MKCFVKILMLCCVVGLVFASCNDDFLQQDPTTELAEGNFFDTEEGLPLFLNQLYPKYIQGHQGTGSSGGWAYDRIAPFYDVRGSGIMFKDLFSDNLVERGNARARLSGNYHTPASGTNEGWEWSDMRTINYFLRNYRNAEKTVANPSDLDKYAAEAYFFKAWDYYNKLVTFGEVPWFVTDLNINSPELYAPRTPRNELVDSIMKCINFAVAHLDDNDNPLGRINKDMANFLKARIALFEGSFRKYHTELNLQSSANTFFKEAADAAQAIRESGHYELYDAAGQDTNAYWRLFTFKGMTIPHKEAILARVYDGSTYVGHCTQRYYAMNSGASSGRFSKGATKGLVDEYLCIDGKPTSSSPLFKGYDGMWSELYDRDPRLRCTVTRPGEFQSITFAEGGPMDVKKNGITYPTIGYNDAKNEQPLGTTVTGYWIIKHVMMSKEEYDAVTSGTQTALEFRYAEALLMEAEAKAELGTITQADLDATVNALRIRAGFDFAKYPDAKLTVDVSFADANLDAINANYLDYAVTPLLREIRRERRVEMAVEGRRYEDLMRWKAGKFFTIPLRGMKMTDEKKALYDGSNASPKLDTGDDADNSNVKTAKKATIGTEIWVDGDGFLIPYPKDPLVPNGVLSWDDRRYYWPIPLDQLTLNKNLKQNPEWEDISR